MLLSKQDTHLFIVQSLLLLMLFSLYAVSDSFATPWTVARQVPLPMEFSQYWSGLPFPLPRISSQPRDRTHVSRLWH